MLSAHLKDQWPTAYNNVLIRERMNNDFVNNVEQNLSQEITRQIVEEYNERLGLDSRYCMTGPMTKARDAFGIEHLIEAKTKIFKTLFTPGDSIQDVVLSLVEELEAMITALPSGHKFCPFVLVDHGQTVVDKNTLNPVVSFRTRYGVFEHQASFLTLTPKKDFEQLIQNSNSSRSTNQAVQNLEHLTHDLSMLNQIFDIVLGEYASELGIDDSGFIDRTKLSETRMYKIPIELFGHTQLIADTGSIIPRITAEEYINELSYVMYLEIKKLIDELNKNQIEFKMVELTRPSGIMIDPNSFMPTMFAVCEYAII
jgi:hypothetical protein